MTGSPASLAFQNGPTRTYFGSRLLGNEDRLGSRGKYFPYGEDRTSPPSPPNDQVKFATYTRDSATGLDYADQRYYTPSMGRFMTPDPYSGSEGPTNPQSWNRYAYVAGDPINYQDLTGQYMLAPKPPSVQQMSSLLDLSVPGIYSGAYYTYYSMLVDFVPGTPDTSIMDEWDNLSSDCQNGLQTAMPKSKIPAMVAALNRAGAAESTLQTATAGTNIDWTMLAAIGIRESGFVNKNEVDGAGVGVGIFQITVSPTSGVTAGQAGKLAWSASYAANFLNNNMATLANKFPNFTPDQLLQATAASYNFGTKNISGNPDTIDVGTSHNNYGSNILDLMKCF